MIPVLVVILQFFASLTILVMIHEFGHYLMARLFGVRVEKFYLFFNPGLSLFRYKLKGSDTEYGVGWLPLGGYVKMSGMIDESLDRNQMKSEPKPWEFRSKPAWQRFLITIMGVVFNFILALFIYSMIAFNYGDRYIPFENITEGLEFSDLAKSVGFQDGDNFVWADSVPIEKPDDASFRAILEAKQVCVLRDGKEVVINMPEDFMEKMMEAQTGFVGFRYPFVVDSVLTGSRAERAGLMAGDSLMTIGDSLAPAYVSTSVEIFGENRNIPVPVTLKRGKETVSLTVTPDYNGKVGVYMRPMSAFYESKVEKYGFFESFGVGISRGVKKLTNYAGDMKYVFTKAGVQSLGGFMTIGSLFPYPFDARMFWEMTAFLSVILAFMNILPIPALDGGHLVFILYEMITRKKPSENVVMKAQVIGMFFLFILLIYANLNDVFRFFS